MYGLPKIASNFLTHSSRYTRFKWNNCSILKWLSIANIWHSLHPTKLKLTQRFILGTRPRPSKMNVRSMVSLRCCRTLEGLSSVSSSWDTGLWATQPSTSTSQNFSKKCITWRKIIVTISPTLVTPQWILRNCTDHKAEIKMRQIKARNR